MGEVGKWEGGAAQTERVAGHAAGVRPSWLRRGSEVGSAGGRSGAGLLFVVFAPAVLDA